MELVDGQDILEVIDRIPEQEADHLLKLATAGDFEIPSCPTCHNKMIAHDTRVPIPWRKPTDARFRKSGIVSDDLWCRSLIVDEGVEVQFLRPVQCVEADIAGDVSGNINCRGPVVIQPGGTVSGLVGAKSMDVADGAHFDGQLTLLNGTTVADFPEVPKRLAWICPTETCCSGSFRPRNGWQPAEQS